VPAFFFTHLKINVMARIQYSALVTSIRGSIGGTTFQKNAYGFSVKNKANLIRPNSQLQNQHKNFIGTVHQLWNQLGTDGQAVWNSYALAYPQFSKFNTASRLSGHAVFLKRNLLCWFDLSWGVDTPAFQATLNPAFTPIVNVYAGPYLQVKTNAPLNNGTFFLLYVSKITSVASPVRRNMFKFMGFLPMLSTDIIDISAMYSKSFGGFNHNAGFIGIILRPLGISTGAVFAEKQFYLPLSVV
jgi:hypothetical protein